MSALANTNETTSKTYNMGRVVGWSAYEEFIKEHPDVDTDKLTPQIYTTLCTYGVTRIVEIPSNPNKWRKHTNDETTFYTTTIQVQGATFGAVPIVGINYDAYVDAFYPGQADRYHEALPIAGANKENLEKAFSCIFTCYVSDSIGTRARSSISDSGYLTFAAYPDIVDFLEIIAEYGNLKVIVRGLSLVGLDVDSLYYGPQGLVISSGGVGGGGAPVKYCEQETIDISALCLNASGYIWMSTGGSNPGSGVASFTSLANHPHGDLLISTFGYLNPEMVEGTGAYENIGQYAYTYDEYKHVRDTEGFHILKTQIEPIEAVSQSEPYNYLYLLDGRPSYDTAPPSANPLYVIPVRKSDYYVNVGTFDNFTTPKLKKPLDLFRKFNNDDIASNVSTLYIANKATQNYFGSYWAANNPSDCQLSYWDSSSLKVSNWITVDVGDLDDAYYDFEGRYTVFQYNIASKGDFIVISNQTGLKALNAIYHCVSDRNIDGGAYNSFVRRGAWLDITLPDWVYNRTFSVNWEIDLSQVTTRITNGVLYVKDTPIYPGELLILGNASRHKQFLVLNTITNGSTVELIVSTQCELSISVSDEALVADGGDEYTNILHITTADVETAIRNTTIQVNSDETQTHSFTLTNTAFTDGLLFNVKHIEPGVYGYNKYCRYVLLRTAVAPGSWILASGQLWDANPNLSTVAGHPGTYNSAFPRYNQTLPQENGSYYYNVPAALAHTKAKKFFQDFGLDIADYVHEDFQELTLGKFLQECVLRTDLSIAPASSTMRASGIESTLHLYSKTDLQYTSGNIPTPTASNPISASLILDASTPAQSYFSTAYYTGTLKDGKVVDISNSEYPIWASSSKSPDGSEIMSISVTDNGGSQLDFSGNSGTIEADTITWLDMLIGLGSGKSVDVLKGARFGRDNNDCNYIQTADGTRLYISTTEPTGDIPEGSIGIGW